MKLSLGKKLSLSFAVVISLMAISAVIVYVNLYAMRQHIDVVVDKSMPAVRAADRLLGGVNQSLAALRGYLILGDDEKQATYFRAERADAWQDIDKSLQTLNKYVSELSDADRHNVERVATLIEDLRTAQQSAEDIGQSDANVPSLQLLRSQMLPQAKEMLSTLTAMIEAEAQQEAAPQRRRVLKTMADLRAAFTAALAATMDYQLSGKESDSQVAETKWQDFETNVDAGTSWNQTFLLSKHNCGLD